MAKLQANGDELFRYLDPRAGGLLSVRSNGVVLRKTPFSGGWKVYARKKADVPLEEWANRKAEAFSKTYAWQRVKSIPSSETLNRWAFDGVAETVTGDTIEPDGVGVDGAPSWLLVFAVI